MNRGQAQRTENVMSRIHADLGIEYDVELHFTHSRRQFERVRAGILELRDVPLDLPGARVANPAAVPQVHVKRDLSSPRIRLRK